MAFFASLKNLFNSSGDNLSGSSNSQEWKQAQRITQLKEENLMLKEKIRSKTVELAAKAKEYDEQNKVLKSAKEHIEGVLKHPGHAALLLKDALAQIDSVLQDEDDTFTMQMDELNQDLYDKLRQKFPDLTSNDLRLCAYILKGFSSKEISSLLQIKPSSVYISRSRLRKKLGIDSDSDLTSFLNSI